MSRLSIVSSLVIGLTFFSALHAAPTAEQKAELDAVDALMTKAGTAFKEKKFKECGEHLKEIMSKVETLAASGEPAVIARLTPHQKRILQAHSLLELEGIELPAYVPLADLVKKAKADKAEKPAPKDEAPGATPAAPAAGGVSFTKQVVPVLMARCGGCHVRKASGGLGFPDYASLMKGTRGDTGFLAVIIAGKAEGSVLIDKIVDGEMPPNGKMPAGEIEMLKAWIDQGAKFDGANPTVPLAQLATAPGAAPPPKIEGTQVVQATGKEKVSFSRDIAGVLSSTCGNCHGNNRPRENFNLSTFTGLLKGGDGGAPIVPGKPEESYLIKKLKGTGGGQRMPAGGLPPLDDAVMAKIETWIKEGAKFDAPDAGQPLAEVAALAKAANSSHAELSADRAKAAETAWGTSFPGIEPVRFESENYLILTNLGENTAKDVADRAEQLTPKVAGLLGAPSDKPLLKGRFTLYVVKERFEYTEFGKMVERRDIPPAWRGHWRYTGVEAYGIVLPPKKEADYSIEPLIAQQLAGAYVGSLGKNVPRWFGEGVGRAVVHKVYGSDPRVHMWDERMQETFAAMNSADAFLSKDFDPELGDIASYGFAKYLMTNGSKFNRLLDELRKGAKFDDVFTASLGGTPNALAEVWYRKGPGRPVGKAKPTANKSAAK